MLKKIFVFALVLIKINIVFGQGVKLGVHFDPAIVWFQSDVKDVKAGNPDVGFDFGLSVDRFFARNYAFSTGLSLYNIGGTLIYKNGIDDKNTKDKVLYKMQYIKIPIALKLRTHMIGRFVYSANLGFDPMMRVSAKAEINKDKVNEEISFFNMGWHFGIGTSYSLGGEAAICVGLKFMNTFIDMTPRASDNITSKNLFLCIGVLF